MQRRRRRGAASGNLVERVGRGPVVRAGGSRDRTFGGNATALGSLSFEHTGDVDISNGVEHAPKRRHATIFEPIANHE